MRLFYSLFDSSSYYQVIAKDIVRSIFLDLQTKTFHRNTSKKKSDYLKDTLTNTCKCL